MLYIVMLHVFLYLQGKVSSVQFQEFSIIWCAEHSNRVQFLFVGLDASYFHDNFNELQTFKTGKIIQFSFIYPRGAINKAQGAAHWTQDI